MGVHDLWRLLAPCGHRLTLTTLTRRKLAVDVSIWIQQFLKALPTSQPHLLGLLRRLCKLHYYHIYPVMVFDGPAPNLKKRTLEERRRTRERQRESFERVAERLLLEQLKMKSVKELRRQMAKKKREHEESQREEKEAKAKAEQSEERKDGREMQDDDDVVVMGDETSSPGGKGKKATRRARAVVKGEERKDDPALMTVVDDVDDDPEMLLLRQLQREEDANASLDLIAQWEGEADDANERSTAPALFKAQPLTALTAEEKKLGLAFDYISPDEEEDLLPVHDPLSYQLPANGELDSSVLASLPISLQYSLLEQHRSHHHNMSLRRYAQVKDDTAAFSAMQMGAFLKQVQFNKEIEVKRQEMNRREERDGMMVKRIAGDGGREYVYMKKDDRKAKEEKKIEEEEEEARLKEEARQQMKSEDSRYLQSHITRQKAQAEAAWRCEECGSHNDDEENDVLGMCHVCGARRTEKHAKGGTVSILLGGEMADRERDTKQPAKSKRAESGAMNKRAPTRVTTFHSASAMPSAQPSAAVYWSCNQCSFLNHMHGAKCEICGAKREDDANTATLDHDQPQPQPQFAQPRRSGSRSEVVDVSDDEMKEVKAPEGQPKQQPAEESKIERKSDTPAVVAASESVEISFDAEGGDDGDDLFPADFFDAFDQPSPAKAQPAPTQPAPTVPSPTAAATDAIASPTKSHLTLGESIKQRRPRMRLKKLDVKEIIWSSIQSHLHSHSHTCSPPAPRLVCVKLTHTLISSICGQVRRRRTAR